MPRTATRKRNQEKNLPTNSSKKVKKKIIVPQIIPTAVGLALESSKENKAVPYGEELKKLFKDSFGIPSLAEPSLTEKDSKDVKDTPKNIFADTNTHVYISYYDTEILPEDFLIRDTLLYFLAVKGKIKERRICIFWQTSLGLNAFMMHFDGVNDDYDIQNYLNTLKDRSIANILADTRLIEYFKDFYQKINVLFLNTYNTHNTPPEEIFNKAAQLAYKKTSIHVSIDDEKFTVPKHSVHNDFTRFIVSNLKCGTNILKWGRYPSPNNKRNPIFFNELLATKIKELTGQLLQISTSTNSKLSASAGMELKFLGELFLFRVLNQDIRRNSAADKLSHQTNVRPSLPKRLLDAVDDLFIKRDVKVDADIKSKEEGKLALEGDSQLDHKYSDHSKVQKSDKPISVANTQEESSLLDKMNVPTEVVKLLPLLEINFEFCVSFITAMQSPNQTKIWMHQSYEAESKTLWDHFLMQITIWQEKCASHEGEQYKAITEFAIALQAKLKSSTIEEAKIHGLVPHLIYELLLHRDKPNHLKKIIQDADSKVDNLILRNNYVQEKIAECISIIGELSSKRMDTIERKIFNSIISIIKHHYLKRRFPAIADFNTQRGLDKLQHLKLLFKMHQTEKVKLTNTAELSLIKFATALPIALIMQIIALQKNPNHLWSLVKKFQEEAIDDRVQWERSIQLKIANLEPWYKKPIHWIQELSFPGMMGGLVVTSCRSTINYTSQQAFFIALNKFIKKQTPNFGSYGNLADHLTEENALATLNVIGMGAGFYVSSVLFPYAGAEFMATSFVYKQLYNHLHSPIVNFNLSKSKYPTIFHGYSEHAYYYGTTLAFTAMECVYYNRIDPIPAFAFGLGISIGTRELIKKVLKKFIEQFDNHKNPEQQLREGIRSSRAEIEEARKSFKISKETLDAISQLLFYLAKMFIKKGFDATRENRLAFLQKIYKNLETEGTDCARYSVQVPTQELESKLYPPLLFSSNAPNVRISCLTDAKALKEISCPQDTQSLNDCSQQSLLEELLEVEVIEYSSLSQWIVDPKSNRLFPRGPTYPR